jgi:hypothetical protein
MTELEALAAERGLSLNTLRRAKDELRARSEQRREDDRPVWYWSLPPGLGRRRAAVVQRAGRHRPAPAQGEAGEGDDVRRG